MNAEAHTMLFMEKCNPVYNIYIYIYIYTIYNIHIHIHIYTYINMYVDRWGHRFARTTPIPMKRLDTVSLVLHRPNIRYPL